MEPKDAAEFHANHIRLPLPGTATDVLAGALPGSGRHGELAWLEFSSAVDMQRDYNAIVIERERELPSLWVDAEDVTVPGFAEGPASPALEAAAAAGYGLSAAGREVCVYRGGVAAVSAAPSAAELERFCGRAAEIAALV